MFAQFFGGYLLNNGLVSPDALSQAIDDKINTRMRLGVLAINAGLMTAQQVEHVNVSQQIIDKRFGELAVDLGYLTDKDVEQLLSSQPSDYLLIGQTLVNNGTMSNADFESAINDYKKKNQLSDDDISSNQSNKITDLVNGFYHFNTSAHARIYTDYIACLFKSIIRFIGDDFTPLEATVINKFENETPLNIVTQKFVGNYNAQISIACQDDEYITLAERFSKEEFNEVDDFAKSIVGEFLNINNGLFLVNESNENGTELNLLPQEYYNSSSFELEFPAYCIPVAFSFGEVEFLLSIY